MLSLHAHSKDTKLFGVDYILEDKDRLLKLLPYLVPKLEGVWYVALIEPTLETVRMFLNTNIVQDHIKLDIYLDRSSLEQILLEYPSLSVKELTPWEVYQQIISRFPVPMDSKAMREIYFRVGPKREALEEALDKFKELDYVTVRDVDKLYVPRRRIYARQVAQAFLTKDKNRWKKYCALEQELGISIAYYAIRKYIRKLFKEKDKYLNNKETTDKMVDKIDVYTIIHAYYLFSQSTDYHQLPALLSCIERRTTIC